MDIRVLIAFAAVMALVLLFLIKFRINPAIVMFCAAIVMGFASGMPAAGILSGISDGVGGTMASLGLVVAFGGIFGALLAAAGATEELAKGMLRLVGPKNDLLALNLAGFIVSIPVYFASGYLMLSPLTNALQGITKKRMAGYTTSLFVGLLVAHCVVAPTPGPVAVAAQMGANLGWFILYGIIVGLPMSLLCGWLWGNVLAKRSPEEKAAEKAQAAAIVNNKELLAPDPNKPSAGLSLVLILFPILLIVLGAVASIAFPAGSAIGTVFTFIGNNNVALFIGMLTTMVVLRKYLVPSQAPDTNKLFDETTKSVGTILVLLAVGGAFGQIIGASGLGNSLVALLSSMNMPVVLLAFLLAMVLRAAVGSATVAMLTSVAVFGPVATQLGYSPLIVGLAICVGTVGLTLPTDGAFWMPHRFNGIKVNESFSTLTVSTTAAAFVGFGLVMLLNAFSGVLPGMF